MSNAILNQISKQLQDLQKEELWMGQNFEEKFAQISDLEAFSSPVAGIHSVAQIVAHLTAWKKDALLKIKEGKGKLMDDHDENWPENDELKKLGWDKVRGDFDQVHQDLMEALNGHNDQLLHMKYHDQDYKKEYNMAFMLEGLLHHDLYHLGQIGLIIRMLKSYQ